MLTVINGFAKLMEYEIAPDDPLQKLVEKLLSSSRRAADLVRQLLVFSRKQVTEPQALDLNNVVAEMEKMLRRVIGEDIELRSDLAPDLWSTKADPTRIEQIIINLAVNARDAMPYGGRLTIEMANLVLDEDYAATHLDVQPGEHVLLAISDTGLGISEEIMAHIFEPFFTTKEEGKGTGLGLATVYGIVKQSGGHIWVTSQEGEGTTFIQKPFGPINLARRVRQVLDGGKQQEKDPIVRK